MNYQDRLIKNEQLIRDKNKNASIGIKKYFKKDKKATEVPLDFLCECSDINCKEHVKVSIDEYEKIHNRKNRFLIMPGHKSPSVEITIKRIGNLEIVEKPQLSP